MVVENEIWKDVIGYEGLYQVSSFGNVRSVDRQVEYEDKNGMEPRKAIFPGRNLRKSFWGCYYRVRFSKNGKKIGFSIHRIVATMFVPNPQNHEYINHKNGNKLDNYFENLEWVTASENQFHALETGLKRRDANSKLTKEDVHNIRIHPIKYGSIEMLAKKYSVKRLTISNIVHNKSWK